MKEFVKRLIWTTTTHAHGNDPDILLVSSRRSGSTWLMETIAAAERVRYLDQPFSDFRRHESRRVRLPERTGAHYVDPSPGDLREIESYLTDVFSGRVQVNAAWDIRKPTFHRRTDRVVVKLLAAKELVPWICDRFDVRVVYSVRHPVPAALSCLRNDFGLTADSFLHSESFRARHLTASQASECKRILAGNDHLARFVLNWVLENLSMLRALPKRNDWLFVPYESFVLRTEEITRKLATEFNLAGVNNMLTQAGLPSRSTRSLQSTLERDEKAAERLGKWRKHVSDDREKRLMRILELFDIDLYRAGSDVAHYDDGRSFPA